MKPSIDMTAFRDDFLALLKKHTGHLDSSEMLAVAAHSVGQIIAYQDQRKFSSAQIMALVSNNIELGNQEAMANLQKPQGHA